MGTRLHSAEKVAANSTLPTWYEDDFFDGADLGASVIDVSRAISFARQGAPVNGDIIRDLIDASFEPPAAPLAAGSIFISPSNTGALGFDGAKIDFSPSIYPNAPLTSPSVIRMPSRIMKSIWGDGSGAVITAPTVTGGVVNNDAVPSAGGAGYSASDARIVVNGGGGTGASFTPVFTGGVLTGVTRVSGGSGYTSAPALYLVPAAQNFLMFVFITLPSAADFNATTGAITFFTGLQSNNGLDAANLLRVSMVNNPTTNGPGLSFIRQRNSGGGLQINLALAPAHLGQKALIAVYRTATGMTLYCRTAAGGTQRSTSNAGQPDLADNYLDFSNCQPDFGICVPGNPNLGASPAMKNFKIGKPGLEALRVTGRDPETVLSAEWARELARGVHL